MTKRGISPDALQVLIEFSLRYGRTWKAELRQQWERASYPGAPDGHDQVLQHLRNSSYFGPRGLIKIRIDHKKGSIHGC
jgi:hypothetical protein